MFPSKWRLLVICLAGFIISARGQQLYITFNPLNCVNCSMGLYALLREPEIPIMTIVFKEEDQENEEEWEETFEFSRFPKIQLIYEDSLFYALSKDDFESEIIIRNHAQEELYRALLKRFNIYVVKKLFVQE